MRIWLLRVAMASLIALLISFGPLLGLVYGTSIALVIGGLTFVSPLEFILATLGTKTIVLDLFVSSIVFITIIVIFGRFFCGWICPVGVPLELLHFNLLGKRGRKALGEGGLERYTILIVVLLASFIFNFSAPYLFSPPGAAYRLLLGLTMQRIIGIDLFVLGLFTGLDFLAARFGRTWCKSLCPLGTTISTLSLINIFRPKIDVEGCIDVDGSCRRCEKSCSLDIKIASAGKLDMMSCSKCLRCVENCPNNAVKIEIPH